MTEEIKEENSVEETEPESTLYTKMSLKELGPNFPIFPRDSDGKPVKDRSFSFLEWDMEMEELISGLRDKSENTGKFVNKMLCKLFDRFCGDDFQEKNEGQQALAIAGMEFTNVMYAYIYLRVEELGKELKMNLTCPGCKKLIKDFVADLETLEIHVKNEEHERIGSYELKKPIVLGDKIVTKLKYDVSTWTCLEKATADIASNSGKMKRLMFESSITGCEGADGEIKHVDRRALISGLKKIDIEKSIERVVDNNAGPHMHLGGECPHCKTEFVKELQWGYEYFFDSSSL